jgi:hypothetical protein
MPVQQGMFMTVFCFQGWWSGDFSGLPYFQSIGKISIRRRRMVILQSHSPRWSGISGGYWPPTLNPL